MNPALIPIITVPIIPHHAQCLTPRSLKEELIIIGACFVGVFILTAVVFGISFLFEKWINRG